MVRKSSERIEEDLLLDAILQKYGYDFRNYARSSLRRRIQYRINESNLENISELIGKVLHSRPFFSKFLTDLSITVTEMFRDPFFFQELRDSVIPHLKTYPYVKIWHAGCATGEEVYSMAILLHEEDFLSRSQIYATDLNTQSLEIAKEGIYPNEAIRSYTKNYNEFGGKSSFSDYYHSHYRSAKLRQFLKENITWSNHNLVTDGSFGEMNVVICRNVLIYFDKQLQDRVLNVFDDSLPAHGFLALGTKETIEQSKIASRYSALSRKGKIFKKKS